MFGINNGGADFPLAEPGNCVSASEGMSLRDYFAANAMQGLLAAQVHGFNDQPAKGPFASMAYEMADAMIAAREKQAMNARLPSGPCLCGALDCRACRGSDAYDPDIEADDQRDDYAMRALVDELFNEVICGRMTPKEAGDQLDAAGVPFDVQCRVLIGATKEIAA